MSFRNTAFRAGQALATALLLVACEASKPSPAASAPAPAAAAAPAPDGRPLTLLIDAEPAHLNPDVDPDVWSWRLSHDAIYEPLVRRKPDGTFEPVLADRFTVDGERLTFHIRPGVLFHDDKPLAASDVLFTFSRVRGRGRTQGMLGDLATVEPAGPETVRMWAARPSSQLLPAIAEVAILPEHVFGRGDLAYQGGNRRPVGTGPLRLREWERGRRIVLERFPKYWGAPAAAEIDVDIEPDPAKALGRARRGEIDLLGRVPPAWVPEQLESPTLKREFQVRRSQPARFVFVLWNVAHPPLDDVAVRRALALAVDRARLLADVRHGVGRAVAAPALGGAPAPEPAFDLAAANAALDAAGLARMNGDGMRARNGRPIRLAFLVPKESHESAEVARRVGDALARVGIAVEPQVGDFPILLLRLRKGMFDAALLSWSGRDDDDLSPLFRSTGAQNYGRYASREVDQLLDALRSPSTPDRPGAFARLAASLAADPPALFLYAPDEVYLLGRRLGHPRPDGDFVLLRDFGVMP